MPSVLYEKDGPIGRITRHSPEGIHFKSRAETVGWKQAVQERDDGTFDWTTNRPMNE